MQKNSHMCVCMCVHQSVKNLTAFYFELVGWLFDWMKMNIEHQNDKNKIALHTYAFTTQMSSHHIVNWPFFLWVFFFVNSSAEFIFLWNQVKYVRNSLIDLFIFNQKNGWTFFFYFLIKIDDFWLLLWRSLHIVVGCGRTALHNNNKPHTTHMSFVFAYSSSSSLIRIERMPGLFASSC